MSNVSPNMFRLTNATCFFELELLREEDVTAHGYRSVLFRASASSDGFCGQAESWAFTESVEHFCKSLVSLHSLLKGEASLDSVSPSELSVKLASINLRGYLGVSGAIGNFLLTENSNYWHSVSFGFEFEPAQLQIAIQTPWVAKYAG